MPMLPILKRREMTARRLQPALGGIEEIQYVNLNPCVRIGCRSFGSILGLGEQVRGAVGWGSRE